MPGMVFDLAHSSEFDGFVFQGILVAGGVGVSTAKAGDINGDGIDDVIIGVPGGIGPDVPGKAYVIYGRIGGLGVLDPSTLSANDGFVIEGNRHRDSLGLSVSGAGDVNGDGIDDLIVGAPNADDGGDDSGQVYVIYGKLGTDRGRINLANLDLADGFRIQGDIPGDNLGRAVSGAGDINGDGVDDLVVAGQRGTFGTFDEGQTYVIYGQVGWSRTTIDLSNFLTSDGFIVRGDTTADLLGESVSGAGDIDGDGIGDLIFGAPYGDDGGNMAGEAYVIYGTLGNARSLVDLTNLTSAEGFAIQGDNALDFFGRSVSWAGDVNGDGLDDVVIGATHGDDGGGNAGEAYVIYGQSGRIRERIDVSALAPGDGFIIQGDVSGDQAGVSVSGAGDVNGDGIDDIIVGASFGDDGDIDAGEAYVIFGVGGTTRPTVDLTGLDASQGFIIQGDAGGDHAGRSVSAAGDVNGDGLADIAVGAPSYGVSNEGRVYVIYGFRPPIVGTSSQDTLTGAADADTISGLGGNDVINGGQGADRMRGGVGNDIYFVDSAGDVVEELVDEGSRDRINSSLATYTLPSHVENLTYIGGGTFNGTGNALTNMIEGGGQADTLFGLHGDDTLAGGEGDDFLEGGSGSDRLFGGTGADTMNGEDGNDRMVVDNVGDTAVGGAGIDTVQIVTAGLNYAMNSDVEIISNLSGGALMVSLNGLGNTYGGSAGIDSVHADDGQDSVYGRAGNDLLRGQGGNDYLFGEEGVDTLEGGDGVDYLYGGTEDDMLLGGAGNDLIYGQDGADLVSGGAGQDLLNGGAGSDRFVFNAAADTGSTNCTADRISDFSQAQGDLIDLSAIDAAAGVGDDVFAFIGAGIFTNVAGQLRYEYIGGNTYIQGDTNGDGVADLMIRVDGLHTLTAGDFFL